VDRAGSLSARVRSGPQSMLIGTRACTAWSARPRTLGARCSRGSRNGQVPLHYVEHPPPASLDRCGGARTSAAP
jgi:hypothetical protein